MRDLASLFAQIERERNLPQGLLHALAQAESRGNPKAVSPGGDKGLFQISPITQQHLKVKDPFNPEESAHAAGRYLSELQNRFGPDLQTILAAWNWGPTNVRRQGTSDLPIPTKKLIQRTLKGLPQPELPPYMSETGAGEFGLEQRPTEFQLTGLSDLFKKRGFETQGVDLNSLPPLSGSDPNSLKEIPNAWPPKRAKQLEDILKEINLGQKLRAQEQGAMTPQQWFELFNDRYSPELNPDMLRHYSDAMERNLMNILTKQYKQPKFRSF